MAATKRKPRALPPPALIQRTVQCKACPWKKSTKPGRDIPGGYCETKHANLQNTIARPGEIRFGGTMRVMACHEAIPGSEYACVGWLVHQLGEGNNIGLRMRVAFDPELREKASKLRTVGAQHRSLAATLGDDEDDYFDGDP